MRSAREQDWRPLHEGSRALCLSSGLHRDLRSCACGLRVWGCAFGVLGLDMAY